MNDLDGCLRRLKDDEPRILTFLKNLIRTPSLSGNEGSLAELITLEMETLGYDVEIDDMGSVLGTLGDDDGRTILFDGHMDHVDTGSLESWSHNPYEAEVLNGLIYGRGAVDMKASLAAMIHGCAASQITGKVLVACVVHEETYEGVAVRKLIEKRVPKPAVCVLGEPTNLNLSIGQRGRSVFKISTKGVTSHASMPELGKNAIYKMLPIINHIREANQHLPSHSFLGSGSITVTSIKCRPGDGPIIPDHCEILVDRRLVPQENLGDVLEKLRSMAAGSEVELVKDKLSCYTGYHTMSEQYFPGWIIDREHWAVKESLQALEEMLGGKPEIIGWKFSTDGVATAGALSIPTIGFGPGDPALAHQPDEHVALSDVTAAARGYCALAHKLSHSRECGDLP